MKAFVFCLAFLTLTVPGSPFTFVMIDAETERMLGEYPLDRAVLAKGIGKIAQAKPRAIALKLFFDLPKEEGSDSEFEKAICQAPVILQASLDQKDGNATKLDPRFTLNIKTPPQIISGAKGYIPLPRFARCARDIGFVDFKQPDRAPLIGKYQDQTIKSFYLCALEAALGDKATFPATDQIQLGSIKIQLDDAGAFPMKPTVDQTFTYIPFHELLSEPVEHWSQQFTNKVVIVGYDGAKIHSIETKDGKMRAHRFFCLALLSLYESLQAGRP